MNRPAAADVLHALLRSEDGTIRVAAAMSILRLLSPYYTPKEVLAPGEAEVKRPAVATATATASAPAASAPATATKPVATTEKAPEPKAPDEVVVPRPKLESSGPK